MSAVLSGLPPIAPVAAPTPAEREARRNTDNAPQVRPQTRAALDAAGRPETGYGGPSGRRDRGATLDIEV